MLNRNKNVQVSDATGDDSSYAAGHKKFIPSIFLLLFIFLAVSSQAQKILTLEEAVGNALEKNYDIILSRNDSAIAAIDYSYRNAFFIPRLNANVGTVWNNNNSQKQTLADGTKQRKQRVKIQTISTHSLH